MTTLAKRISVLCVDDNEFVGESMQRLIGRSEGLQWLGWLETANDLQRIALERRPDVVVLDFDMPGKSALEAIQELAAAAPEIRIVVYSGHVRRAFIEQSLAAGAWGYISKSDEQEAIVRAIRDVAQSRVALSPEVRAEYEKGRG